MNSTEEHYEIEWWRNLTRGWRSWIDVHTGEARKFDTVEAAREYALSSWTDASSYGRTLRLRIVKVSREIFPEEEYTA